MRILARADEAHVALVTGAAGCGGHVAVGIHALGQELYAGDLRGPEPLHLGQARDVHPLGQPGEGEHRRLRLEVEIPEGARASAKQRAKGRLAEQDGVPGQQHEVRRERVGSETHRPPRQRPGVARPPHHVHQAGCMPQRARVANDRGFGLVPPPRSEHGHSHAPSITDQCASPS